MTSTLRNSFGRIALVALLGVSIAAPIAAQPAGGPGMGPGQGMGQGGGMGPGGGKAMRFNFNKDNTPGWTLMSAEERAAHSGKMRAAKTYDECKALQAEHQPACTTCPERAATTGVPARFAISIPLWKLRNGVVRQPKGEVNAPELGQTQRGGNGGKSSVIGNPSNVASESAIISARTHPLPSLPASTFTHCS